MSVTITNHCMSEMRAPDSAITSEYLRCEGCIRLYEYVKKNRIVNGVYHATPILSSTAVQSLRTIFSPPPATTRPIGSGPALSVPPSPPIGPQSTHHSSPTSRVSRRSAVTRSVELLRPRTVPTSQPVNTPAELWGGEADGDKNLPSGFTARLRWLAGAA